MKIHKLIVLRFWVKSGVNLLYVGWAHITLVLYLLGDPLSKDPTMVSKPGSCSDRTNACIESLLDSGLGKRVSLRRTTVRKKGYSVLSSREVPM